MSIEESVQTVKNFLAALGDRNKQGLLALAGEDIEWIIPGQGWPLAGTHRGHAGLEKSRAKSATLLVWMQPLIFAILERVDQDLFVCPR
jgi:ketosteroid isomerase-like protein